MTYEDLKQKISSPDNKRLLLLAACFALVFVVGFGVGRYERQERRAAYTERVNYNMKPEEGQKPEVPAEPAKAEPEVQGATVGADCPVKGNISSNGKKVYHVKGGAFYDRTNPEQCFKAEAEAKAAGFTKSSR